MKKIRIGIIALVCLAMLLTLAACGEKEPDASQPQSDVNSQGGNTASDQPASDTTSDRQDPQTVSLYDALSNLIENGAVKNSNISVTVTGAIKAQGEESPLTLNATVNTESETEQLVKLSLNLMNLFVIENQTYRHGDEVYTDTNGIKVRQTAEEAENGLLSINVDDLKEGFGDLVKENKLVESLKQIMPTAGADGSAVYEGSLLAADMKETIDKAAGEEELTEQLPDTVGGLTQLFDPSTITMQDAPFKIVFDKEGRIVSAEGTVAMSMDMDEQAMEISLTLDMRASYPGKVEAPNDLDEYKEPITMDNYDEVYGLLFDEDGHLIENNETAYNLLCAKYGQAAVDNFIEMNTINEDWEDSDENWDD